MNVDKDMLEALTGGQEPERPDPDHPQGAAQIQSAKSLTHEIAPNDPAVEAIDAFLRDHHKIQAIKAARNAFDMGLKEAKELIEERQLFLGLRTPSVGFSLFGLFKKSA